jgi:hemerythrin-like domain-containing protein
MDRRRDDGLEMMERSHRRLEERLGELERAASAIVRERASDADIAAVDAVLDYLERSATRHETDEEESLFPRLRRELELSELIADLLAEHVLHRRQVGQLRTLRSGWPDSGPDAGDGASLAVASNELARAYRSHIAREEHELMPIVRDRLSAIDRSALADEMQRRRDGANGEARQARGAGRGSGDAARRSGRRRPAGSAGRRARDN